MDKLAIFFFSIMGLLLAFAIFIAIGSSIRSGDLMERGKEMIRSGCAVESSDKRGVPVLLKCNGELVENE